MTRVLVVAAALPLWLALAACAGHGGPSSPATSVVTVLSVNATMVRDVDGDTIVAKVARATEKVRLIGIDTPESVKPDTPVMCFGEEASRFTGSLLPRGTRLHLELDAETRDVYGRLLAYVYRAGDGLFVNLELARQGYAQPLTIAPNTAHATQFIAAANDAKAARRGLWGACTGFDVPATR
jgi:micrococcal nuclease